MTSHQIHHFQLLDEAKSILKKYEQKRDLHVSVCSSSKIQGLIPACCADLHILVQEKKNIVDETRAKISYVATPSKIDDTQLQ